MRRTARKIVLGKFLALSVVLGFASRAPSRAEAGANPVEPPRLVVLVAVDGLSWDVLWSRRETLRGGLGRLLAEGWVETNCHYRHLNTVTGAGHASLATGAPPRVHGVVGNSWCEKDPGGFLRTVVGTRDPLGSRGSRDREELLGPTHLRVATLGDRLLEERPGALVVAVGGKARGTTLLAGRDPRHIAYWQAISTGRFVTGPPYEAETAASKEAARIVSRFDDERIGSGPGFWLSRVARSVLRFLGGVFTLRGVRGAAAPLAVLPSNTLLTDLALEFLRSERLALGRDDIPDLLCLAYSETDAVFHRYGTSSREADEAVKALDVDIGRLLDGLAAAVPPGRILLGLSADHGFLPSSSRRADQPANLAAHMERKLAEELCLSPSDGPFLIAHAWAVWYSPAAFRAKTIAGPCGPAGREVAPADFDRALERLARTSFAPFLEAILLGSTRDRWGETPHAEFARNLLAPGREADAYLFPRPGVLRTRLGGDGSDHGSHHDYDTHVPLVFWGGGIEPRHSSDPSTPYDLAPTLAARLGFVLPDATGRNVLERPPERTAR